MKALLAMIVLLSSSAFAAPVPPLHKMSCWDHTFAYNQLEVAENAGAVELQVSGQNLEIFTALTGDKGWGQIVLKMAFPAGECRASASDPKLLTCAARSVSIKLEDLSNFGRKPKTRTIVLEDATVALRKVSEAGMNFNELDTTHYELNIDSYTGGHVTKFSQKYAHGLTIDATANCELK